MSIFSAMTAVDGTLIELRQAWKKIDFLTKSDMLVQAILMGSIPVGFHCLS